MNDLDLEDVAGYVHLTKAKAAAKILKAKATAWVALILILAVVLALPLHVAVVAYAFPSDVARLDTAFAKWYDVMSPLAGVVVGALFGLSMATKSGAEI